MKKLLTILILLLAVASQSWATTKVETILWESTYDGEITLGHDVVSTLSEGDILNVYMTVTEDASLSFMYKYHKTDDDTWPQVAFSGIAGEYPMFPWQTAGTTVFSYTLTSEDITGLNQYDSSFICIYQDENNKISISKVTVTKEKSIDFSNLVDGDLIRIIHSAGDGSKTLSVKTGETSLYNDSPAADATTTEFAIEAGNVNAIKTNGIQVESALTVSEIQSESPANSAIWRYSSSSFNTKTVTTTNFTNLNNIEIGNRLTVTINKSADVSLAGTFNNGSEDINVCDISNWEESKDIVVTSANIDNIKSNGLTFTGSNVDYVKVEIKTSENTGTISESGFSRKWNSTADSGNPKQVTFNETYGVAGWEIGDTKYNDATSITVNLAETPSQTIEMVLEYANLNGKVLESKTTFSGTSASINVPQSDLLKLRCLYLKSPDATTTITLGSVRILTPALIDASTCVYEVANTVVSSAVAGNKIGITYENISEGDMTLQVGTTDGGTDILASTTVTGTTQDIEVTADNLNNITTNGLYLRGSNIKITNVVVSETSPTPTELTVVNSDNSTSLPFALGSTTGSETDWSKYVTVSKEQFASVKTGDIITVGIKDVISGAQISLKDMSDDWPALEESTQHPSVETSATSYTYTVTATTAAKLKATGLVVSGHHLTISSLTLTSSETDVTQYSLTINSANGSITAYPASSDGKYDSGAQVTLTAKPSSGYEFSQWSDGTNDLPAESDGSLKVTMDGNKSVTATFVPSITTSSFSAMGTAEYAGNVLSASGSIQAYIGLGSTITGTRFNVTTSAASKLKVEVYYVGDSSPSVYETITTDADAKKSYELKLDKDKMIEKIQISNQSDSDVTFSSISLGQDDDATGTISTDDLPYGSNSTYTQGNKTVVFTGSENARGWNVGGTTYNGKTITVTFASEPALENGVITLVLEYYDAHGALKEASNVNTGNTIELEVPDGTQAVKRAYLTVASTGEFVLSEITATTIVKYTLTKNATNGAIRVVKSNGDVTTDTEIKAGEVLKLWAIGDDGYDFTEWTIGGSTSTANPYTLTMDAAKEVTATFAEAPTDPSALWSGSKAINWNTVEIAASNFESANTGDKIIINVDYVGDDDWPKVALRKNASEPLSGAEDTQLSSSMTSVTYYINESMLADLKQSGLFVSGAGYRLKSVKLEADDDPTTVWTGLVAGSTNFDTNDVLNTNNEKILAGVEAKDTIYIYTTGVATGASYKLEYKVGDSWTWTELISGAVPEIIKYAATAESALLIADRGLVISGSGYSINKISLHKFKETPLTAGETRTLWENADGTAVTWNKIGTQGATLGAILEAGEKILVTVKSASTTETDRQVCLRDANSEIVTGFSSFDEVTAYPYVAKFTLTSDYVDKLKNGFHISGTNTTVTKMELYKPLPDTRTEKNLYGEAAMDSTVSDGITIAAEKFVNISEDDVLMIYLSGTKATDFITLRETTNWTQLTSSYKEYMTAGQTVFTLTLNDVNVAKLKAGGLILTGGNFTITKITIKTNGEIPADEGGEEEGGDDETIIDEETGEADLSQLAAQDDSKTTLTQNEDGSITMTTTEAYQAAQIWFNDPEPVAGNVLKVELAESSVNVTVTVKYTDGTESQMSANTMVAKARGVTRAVSSGSTIEVPLDAGKEVQNIEVKNNVAGTITIKKMQVTTVNVFTGGVANLAMLKPQSNATYDTAAHTLATTKGWTGATISPVAGENVSGKELLIEFADASKVKVAVKYRTDVEGPSTIMEKAAKAVRLALDNTKNIQEISIQPTEASIVTFKKIAVNSEETDDGSLKPGKTITLWESATGETLAWNEVAKQDASVGETLKEYDELLITVSGVTKGCDWPKVFIRDASSEQAGNEVLLNDISSFPYTVRIVLTGEMAQQLKKGFSICGDGVTVTKLQVYRPEAPKPGDIHLADLNYGYNSSYDKGTHTITTTARWAARGWEIGDKRYNDKNLITVKFEAVDFPVTLKMEYTTGLQTAQATSVGVPAGRTELLLEIPSGISKLNRVYIIYENPGSVKLTEASVTYQDNLKLSTAIKAFEADGVIRDGRYDTDGWYNLRGMRIPEPKTSGVYIHGGKKVVIY